MQALQYFSTTNHCFALDGTRILYIINLLECPIPALLCPPPLSQKIRVTWKVCLAHLANTAHHHPLSLALSSRPMMNMRTICRIWCVRCLRGSHGLSARRARRTKSRGPKGPQLEVGARRAPRLLVLLIFIKPTIFYSVESTSKRPDLSKNQFFKTLGLKFCPPAHRIFRKIYPKIAYHQNTPPSVLYVFSESLNISAVDWFLLCVVPPPPSSGLVTALMRKMNKENLCKTLHCSKT